MQADVIVPVFRDESLGDCAWSPVTPCRRKGTCVLCVTRRSALDLPDLTSRATSFTDKEARF